MSQLGGRPMTVREILDRARVRLDHRYTSDSSFITSALVQLSSLYSELGDNHKIRRELLDRAEAIAVASHDRRDWFKCGATSPTISAPKASTKRPSASFSAPSRTRSARRILPSKRNACTSSRRWRTRSANRRGAVPPYRAIAIRDSAGKTHDYFYVSLLDVLGYTLDRQNILRRDPRSRNTLSRYSIHRPQPNHEQRSPPTQPRRDVQPTWRGRDRRVGVRRRPVAIARERPTGRIPQRPSSFTTRTPRCIKATWIRRADLLRCYATRASPINNYWEGRALFGLAQV